MTTAGTKPVRLGIVGCGRLAERGYVPALGDIADARLVAVADPSPEQRALVVETVSTLFGRPVAGYDTIGALLGASPLDAVLIASPVGSHVADARAVAAAGVAALVEKPPAPDLAGAVELAGLAPRPWLGFNRRFDPGARAVRSAVPAEGPVDLLLRLRYRRPSWGAHTVRDDALLDLGPHLIDWARWLSRSDILDVAGIELGTERAVLELTLGRGRARLEAATDLPHQELVEVRDGSGRLVARHRTGGLVAGVRARVRGRGPDALVTSLRGEIVALVAAVRGAPSGHDTSAGRGSSTGTDASAGRGSSTGTDASAGGGSTDTDASADLGTPADGIAVMAAIAAARASAADGGRRVPLPIEEHR